MTQRSCAAKKIVTKLLSTRRQVNVRQLNKYKSLTSCVSGTDKRLHSRTSGKSAGRSLIGHNMEVRPKLHTPFRLYKVISRCMCEFQGRLALPPPNISRKIPLIALVCFTLGASMLRKLMVSMQAADRARSY